MKVDWAKLAGFGKPFASAWLEGRYDDLFKSQVGAKMRQLDRKSKGGMGIALGVLFGIVGSLDSKGKPMVELLQDLSSDGAARIMKRLRDQDITPDEFLEAKRWLSLCDAKAIQELTEWKAGLEPDEIELLGRFFGQLTDEEAAKFLQMDAEHREVFMETLCAKKEPKKRALVTGRESSTSSHDSAVKFHQSLREKIEAERAKRRAFKAALEAKKAKRRR